MKSAQHIPLYEVNLSSRVAIFVFGKQNSPAREQSCAGAAHEQMAQVVIAWPVECMSKLASAEIVNVEMPRSEPTQQPSLF